MLLDVRENLCILFYVWTFALTTESVLMMTIVSIDRCANVKFPFKYHLWMTKRKAILVICATWVLSLSINVVLFFENNWSETTICSSYLVLTKGQRLAIIIVFFLVTVTTLNCYGYIMCVTIKQRRSIQVINLGESSLTINNSRKSVKLYFIVFSMFLICWLPSALCSVLSLFRSDEMPLPQWFIHISVCVGLLNTSLNFLVYGWQNKDFRKAYKKIICK
ncbi:melatonin receptor type 1B-B-like [Patella vulgata]|uniref:melatonin receptor type 1B-B-like n=1 Tax=Patella vulgata TaxID=6465 RepID=UPI0024A88B24|nr:melatonin receptor type 1B-B-like [Patella vulgata]